jgi:putative heme-binding domain-containing protein
MSELGKVLGAALDREKLASVLEAALDRTGRDERSWQMALLAGMGGNLRGKAKGEMKRSLEEFTKSLPRELQQRINSLFQEAAALATDTSMPLAARLASVGLLRQADFATASNAFVKLSEPSQPSELQSAAIAGFAKAPADTTRAALMSRERWNGFTPAIREVALSVITASNDLLGSLLNAIEQGEIPAWTIPAERRTQLMKHKDPLIRKRATELFQPLAPGDRMQVYEQLKPVLNLKGNSTNGHSVFQKNCIPCHTFAGEGHMVGPDLTGIRNQPAEVLLLHIVVPEYEIMPIYTSYNVETKDGRSLTGLLAGETSTAITLRMAEGLEQSIPRSNVVTMLPSRLSLMPQELEKAMTRQELADLLAYLKGE